MTKGPDEPVSFTLLMADEALRALLAVDPDDQVSPDAEVVQRRAARVIVVDESGRVLLFRAIDAAQPQVGHYWFTPGGGLDPGESDEAAARREVFEETGLRVASLGPVVLQTRVAFELERVRYSQQEDYFLVVVRHFDLDDSGWSDTERRVVDAHRWWSLDELRVTTETVYPEGLADIVADHLST